MKAHEYLLSKGIKKVHQPKKQYTLTVEDLLFFLDEYADLKYDHNTINDGALSENTAKIFRALITPKMDAVKKSEMFEEAVISLYEGGHYKGFGIKNSVKYSVKGLNQLSKQLNQFVVKAGFDNNDVPLRIALIHSEISEAFEAYRNNNYSKADKMTKSVLNQLIQGEAFKSYFVEEVKDTFEDEIADSIIRLLDLCGKLNIDIEFHIAQKMKFNETRGFKYGNKKL